MGMSIQSFSCSFLMPAAHQSFSDVSRVIVPGVDGRIGILPRHATMIFKLKSGVVSIHTTSGKSDHYFVWGGVASVEQHLCNIVTEAFTILDELDPMILNQKLKGYQADLLGVSLEQEKDKLNYKIAITEAMLRVLKDQQKSLS